MKKKSAFSIYKDQKLLVGLVAIIFIYSFIVRFGPISTFLPFYSLDENELTEFALALFGPDKDPHWYKYGPLYWYILKFIYSIQIFIGGVSTDEFVQNYFISPSNYFLTSRYLAATMHIIMAFVAYKMALAHFNKKSAVITLCIALIPIGDSLTAFLPRIDTLLALNVLCCLYFSLFVLDKKRINSWIYFILMGAFFAFSLSSKPIPSLLLLPSLALVFYFRNFDNKWTIKSNIAPIIRVFAEKGLYIFLCAFFIGLFISNPYAFKSFDLFWAEQVAAVQEEGQRNFESGLNIFRFSSSFGFPLLLTYVGVTSFALYDGIKRKKYALTILASYTFVFWLSFSFGAARNYFYVPVIPPLAILSGYYIRRIVYQLKQNHKLPKSLSINMACGILLLILCISPIYNTTKSRIPLIGIDQVTKHTQSAAQDWIESNIPENSRILYYGYYTSLPKLIDNNINEQARYGDYFMYGRGNNQYWINQYSKAYNRITNDKEIKKYNIEYNLNFQDANGQNQSYYTRYEDDNVSSQIFNLAASQGLDYIVTVYELSQNTGPFNEIMKLDRTGFKYGPKIYIYKRG